ncbi:MAG: hypothetical protein WAL72_28960 [Streptosporangiaceae bacterium]
MEFGGLGPETFQLGSLIRGKRFVLGSLMWGKRFVLGSLIWGKRFVLTSRLRLTVGTRHAHLAVTSAAPAAQRHVDAAVPYHWICSALRTSSLSGLTRTCLTPPG